MKYILRVVKYKLLNILYKNYLKVYWDKGTNFGDAFNPYLISMLSCKKVFWVHRNYYPNEYIMSIGSILQKANKNAIVWGSGFISEDVSLKQKPKKILAVRGPRSRKKLLEMKIDCPEVFGDPALLIPLVYSPKIEKKYKLGIIPHYIDKNNPLLNKFKDNSETIVLDIKMENHFKFIDLVLSCEKIISSSLHGIILADAYKIPSLWIELSNKVKGDGFKFLDYFESVKRKDKLPFKVEEKTTIDEFLDNFYDYEISIDLNKLIEVAPFEIKNLKRND